MFQFIRLEKFKLKRGIIFRNHIHVKQSARMYAFSAARMLLMGDMQEISLSKDAGKGKREERRVGILLLEVQEEVQEVRWTNAARSLHSASLHSIQQKTPWMAGELNTAHF